MSWGDLIVNLISLIPGGALLRMAKSGGKLLKYVPKIFKSFSKIKYTKPYKLISKFTVPLLNIFNCGIDLVTDTRKGIADIGLLMNDVFSKRKLNHKIINKILNNKFVKKITNNKYFNKISKNKFIKKIFNKNNIKKVGKLTLVYLGHPIRSLNNIVNTVVNPKKFKNNLKKGYSLYNKKLTKNIRSARNSKRLMNENVKKYRNQKITKYKKIKKIIKTPRKLIYNPKYKQPIIKTPKRTYSGLKPLYGAVNKLKKGFNQAKSYANKFINKFKIF